MNRGISVLLAVMGAAGMVATFAIVFWVLIGSGLMPWWVAVPPALVFGLVGIGLLNKKRS